MAARPKNNLDELQRRHAASTAPARPAPATPLRSTGKPKFKPAKSIATSTPSSVTVRKLPSFSTPGFNKPKPSLPAPDLSTSAADTSNLSVISISDSDSTAFNASTSSIPAKRLSSASPDEPLPPLSPKRPKTDHVPDKENIFRIDPPVNGKGKSREQTHHFIQPSTKATVGEALLQVSSAHSTTRAPETGPAALRLGLTSLSHDPDLEEKSEEELQGVITTALALIEACNKEIGAARADAGKPRDVLLCNLINDYLEKRLASARALVRAIQRGERPAAGGANSVAPNSVVVPSRTASVHSNEPLQVNSAPYAPRERVNTPVPLVAVPPIAGPSTTTIDAFDMDDELWASFDDGPAFVPDPLPPPAPAPPSPPASQPRSNVPIMTAPARPPTANGPVPDPPDLKAKPYYDQVKHTLTTVFGLQSFRALQLKAICDAMDGRDVFVLFPTGSGKSLTFQLPAVCQDGMTVVVSPLKSLIMDQQRALSKRDVDVEYVLGNGEMSESKRQAIRQRLRTGQPPKLLYLTPEMLHMSDWMKDILKDLHAKRRLMRFVVDEAHLITDWGRTFRDSYIVLSELRKVYPSVPISALTATANAEVEGDIIAKLGLSIHAPLKLSFNRPNLDYDVRHKKKNAVAEIAQYIKQEHPGETGIIYCNARNRCEEVAKALRDDHGLNARHYHASMSEGDRNRVQDMWSKDEVRIIVATIAFGMGIDKPDVRYVIHFNPPGSLKGYYQETGRAGRDGKLAHCILYYATQEFYQRIDWIRKDGQKNGQSPESCRWQEDDFRHVLGYCMNNVRCRRQQVLSFFGEQFAPADCHQMCNNCRDPTPSVTADHTRDAQQAVRLCQSVPRQLTRNQLANALKGSKSQDMVRKGLVGGPFFGACGRMPMGDIERLVDELLHGGFLTTEIVTQGNGYSQPYLLATPRANALLSGKEKLEITFRRGTRGDAAKPPSRARKPRKGGAQDAAAADYDSPSAGPSRTSSSTAPSSRGRRAFVPLPPPEAERSLFQDDPDDENEDEDAVAWAEDEIEEESSPPPAPRRMGTRNVPSASQSVTAGCDSEIEEVDPPPLRVTIIGKEDLRFDGDDGDPETQCNQALTRLRDGISRNDPEIRDLLTEEIIGLLSTTLPNDTEALRNLLECEGISLGLLEPYTKRVLSICTKYCMMRRR